jgi:predicted ATPase
VGGRDGGREGRRAHHLGKGVFVDGGGAEACAFLHHLVQHLKDLVVRVANDGRTLREERREGGREGGRE